MVLGAVTTAQGVGESPIQGDGEQAILNLNKGRRARCVQPKRCYKLFETEVSGDYYWKKTSIDNSTILTCTSWHTAASTKMMGH